jgi:hypothetical protein
MVNGMVAVLAVEAAAKPAARINGEIQNMATATSNTKSSMKITTTALAIALVAALTFVVAASAFTASLTIVEAKKGEAAFHISPQGRAHQSAQGAESSGVSGPPCPNCG